MKTKKEDTFSSEMEEILDGIQDSVEDGVEAIQVGFEKVREGLDQIATQFEKFGNDIWQKRETDKPAEIIIPPHPEGTKKLVSPQWLVIIAWLLVALIPSGFLFFRLEPEYNARQIMRAAYKYSSKPEIIEADALMIWDQDKSAVRRFKRLLRDMEKYHDLKTAFRAMGNNQIGWKVVDHLAVELDWPDAGRVIIVHFINERGQYDNAIVFSNGTIRIFPGERRKYFNTFKAIQKAKAINGI